MITTFVTRSCCIFLILIAPTGCRINDPNYNDKMRWAMAQSHAKSVLEDSAANLESYDVEEFLRRHYDSETKVIHDYRLYDYLKTSPGPGPDRFVIAYDPVTRQTYLRKNLRSNENLDRLLAPNIPSSHEQPGVYSP